MLYSEGVPLRILQHMACVAAVSSQLGTAVYPAIPAILTQIRMHHVSQP